MAETLMTASVSVFSQDRDVANDTLGGAAKGAAGAVGGARFGGMTREPGRDTTVGQDAVSSAAKGGIIGRIAGDADKGAGAVVTVLFGEIRRNGCKRRRRTPNG